MFGAVSGPLTALTLTDNSLPMPHIYFIADLHLSEDQPDITECLMRFLASDAVHADALYILGDLFEYWLGDDNVTPLSTQVANAFQSLASQGVPIFFIHGNRDFLIRQRYATACGMTLLPEQTVIDLYGTPTLIMHGDELCTRDRVYQKFRKKARGWWWPRLMLSLPLSSRIKIAENGRKKSKQNQQKLSNEIMDVTPEEVVSTLAHHKVSRLIHGHTHRPAIHDLVVDNQPAQRIVLGDWYEQGSMLKVSAQQCELLTLAFN